MGFGVLGSGSEVLGVGFRVWGSGFKVDDFECGVYRGGGGRFGKSLRGRG